MMDTYLELNPNLPTEIRELRDSVHRFAREVMRPAAIAVDQIADPQEAIAPGSPLWDFFRRAYSLGYHAAAIPVECGGLGLTGLGAQIFTEEMAWGAADLALSLGVASFPFAALAMTGNSGLIERFVKPFVDDREARLIGCWPVTEPAHGSDWVFGLAGESELEKTGWASIRSDGDSYVINGQKASWVSNGTIATHGLTFLASVQGDGARLGGAIAFVPFDLPGVSRGKPLNKLGQRALNQGPIFFDNVRIPSEYMLVGPEIFEPIATATLTRANGFMAATFTGVARSAFEAALAYSKERVQGGKPICEHQLVQKQLFEMFTCVEACRALSRAVIDYNDRMMASALEHAIAAKVFCTQASLDVASKALQIFGGNGLSKEYPIEKIFRDARASLIEDGTNDVLSLAGARRILGMA
jgi:alkylation response protein AidB-like acyl-CoA dehydrogenase